MGKHEKFPLKMLFFVFIAIFIVIFPGCNIDPGGLPGDSPTGDLPIDELLEDPDIFPPGEVRNISVTATDESITLNWENPADDDFEGCEVWYGTGGSADIQFTGSISNSGTQFDNLTNGTEYTFLMKTCDALSNLSAGKTAAGTPTLNKICFYADVDGDTEIIGIAPDPDGLQWQQLTDNSFSDLHPDWSPDTRKIVFTSNRDGDSDIYIMDRDGSNETALADTAGNSYSPDFSPDGSKIVFYSNHDGGDYEIYIINSDGSGITALTDNSVKDVNPRWSSDGSCILYTSFIGSGNSEIFRMDADGSNKTNLTDDTSADDSCACSPDGSKILFCSSRDGDNEIFCMDSDGSNVIQLTDNAADDYNPSWSADGMRITYTSNENGKYNIYMMDSDGENQEMLTDLSTYAYHSNWSN